MLSLASEEHDADTRLDLLFEAAHLAEEEVGDTQLAQEAYQQVLAHSPKNVAAMRCLEGLLDKSGRLRELVQLLEGQLLIVDSPEERAGLLSRVAELSAGPLGDPEYAFQGRRALSGSFQVTSPYSPDAGQSRKAPTLTRSLRHCF